MRCSTPPGRDGCACSTSRPERFASDEFVRLLRELTIARFVIDEAHCVSEWGHDFRPDYRRLRAAAAACRTVDGRFARPPIAAFTATATPEVRDDIVAMVGLEAPEILVAGFDRPNIRLRVERVEDEEEKHALLPRLVSGRRALVYAATRRSTEAAAATLQEAGVQAAAYHAGMKDDERTRVQDAFAPGSLRVVCATNAFGMGIDRPDVDAVIHFAIPGSVEAYYQEIGRAGRDGRPATATLLWDYADVATRQFLIDSPRRENSPRSRQDNEPGAATNPAAGDGEEVARRKEIEHRKLQRMIAYAETPAVPARDDPSIFRRPRGTGTRAARAATAIRKGSTRTNASSCARSSQASPAQEERYGRRKIVAMLVGDTSDLPPVLAGLSTTGLLRQEAPETLGGWIDAATAAGLIAVSSDKYPNAQPDDLGPGRDDRTHRGPAGPGATPSHAPRNGSPTPAVGRRLVSARQASGLRSGVTIGGCLSAVFARNSSSCRCWSARPSRSVAAAATRSSRAPRALATAARTPPAASRTCSALRLACSAAARVSSAANRVASASRRTDSAT